jgi:hypothetical protein
MPDHIGRPHQRIAHRYASGASAWQWQPLAASICGEHANRQAHTAAIAAETRQTQRGAGAEERAAQMVVAAGVGAQQELTARRQRRAVRAAAAGSRDANQPAPATEQHGDVDNQHDERNAHPESRVVREGLSHMGPGRHRRRAIVPRDLDGSLRKGGLAGRVDHWATSPRRSPVDGRPDHRQPVREAGMKPRRSPATGVDKNGRCPVSTSLTA